MRLKGYLVRTLATIDRNLAIIEVALSEDTFPITGFDFVMDDPTKEPEEIFEPEKGMPQVSGFCYRFEGSLYGEHREEIIDTEIIDEDVKHIDFKGSEDE